MFRWRPSQCLLAAFSSVQKAPSYFQSTTKITVPSGVLLRAADYQGRKAMLVIVKFFTFAVIMIVGTIMMAPAFTDSGLDSEAREIAQFKMKVPEQLATKKTVEPLALWPEKRSEGISLSQIRAIAGLEQGGHEVVSPSLLKELATQNPGDLLEAIRPSAEGDVSEQTKQLITLAVGKAREMIGEDGLFVKPGHTKPKESRYERTDR